MINIKTIIIFILFIILFIIINRNIYETFKQDKLDPYVLQNKDVLDISNKVSDKFRDNQNGINRLAKKMNFKHLYESIRSDPIEFKNNVRINKKLDVRGSINVNGNFTSKDNDNNDGMIKIKNDGGINSQNCGIEIVGGSKQKKRYIDFNESGINRGKILYEGNDSLNFFTGGQASMIIDKSGKGKIKGKLGIGTNNPQSKVHINGNNSEIKFIGQSGHGTKNTILFNDSASNTPLSKIEADDLYNSSHIDIYTKKHNNLDSRLHIHNDGNIGIGNKNPTSKLDVSGRITTDEICIGDICIDEDTLKKLKRIQEYGPMCPRKCTAETNCNNKGTTVDADDSDGCVCNCTGGWSGPNCTIPPPCTAADCNNNGTTTDLDKTNGCECICNSGWEGSDCSISQLKNWVRLNINMPSKNSSQSYDTRSVDTIYTWCAFQLNAGDQISRGSRLKLKWKDQGWGNKKGRVYVRLNPGTQWIDVFKKRACETGYRSCGYELVEAVLPSQITSPITKSTKLEFGYKVGGGGGHKLFMKEAYLKSNIDVSVSLVATEHQSNANNALCHGTVFYGKAYPGTHTGNRLSFNEMKNYNKYAQKYVNGNFNCNNSYFGDPHRGHVKQCYCKI